MIDNTELKEIKRQCLADLRENLPLWRERLTMIDPRLYFYVLEATMEVEGTDCIASVYELLSIRKELRKMLTYELDIDYAAKWVRAIEGVWEDGRHVRGGLKFSTNRGLQHIRLMHFQTWATYMMMMARKEVCMDRRASDGTPLLPTEFVRDGMVWDKRRLCTEADIFITRKAGKTEWGGAMDFTEMAIMGDPNEQVSIVANDTNQAMKIAYKAVKQFAYQIDPASVNKLGGKILKVNAKDMYFLPGLQRTASMEAFAAGGKPKDGWNSGWVHNDEGGQGKYVNEHNDMENTVQELVGSAGTRRERMRLNTSTAGKVITGPYKEHIHAVQESLLHEMEIPMGTAKEMPDDYNFSLLLQLDPWDFNGDAESLNHDYIFRRVNRSIGITVQPTWYAERLHKAKTGTEDERKEVLTKDFNIWQSERVKRWITGDEIRLLMQEKGIRQCNKNEWIAFGGMDFSHGDDLCSIGWVAINPKTKQVLWDCDAWIALDQLYKSPNRVLYEQWVKDGYLHVCPGEILDGAQVLEVVDEVSKHVRLMAFGFDAYDSDRFVNHIRAWMVEKLRKKQISAKAIEEELKQRLQPVSQTFATYNSACQVVWDEVHWNPRKLYVSPNPLIAWCFGNAILQESGDGQENVKPVKNPGTPYAKVDVAQCICTCYIMIGNIKK
jgi:phage terminase large subunit-like protein